MIKLSPSDLTYLYEGCKCCFWLKVKHGIPQPSMPMPGVFSAIAGRQKEFYAGKRTQEFCPDLPPGTVLYGERDVQSKPIAPDSALEPCYIRGRFDVVIEFDDASYGVIDFKTASPSEEKAAMYGRQLEAYAYALEHSDAGMLHLSPVAKLGLLFFAPSGFEQRDLTQQAFTGNLIWVEVERDDARFEAFLAQVMKTLAGERPPASSSGCPWCQYRSRMNGFKLPDAGKEAARPDDTSAVSCPQCGGAMRLRKGKYGDFWSCLRFPACRGTKNP